MRFEELGIRPEILQALREEQYEKPSPIQEKAIPPALAGRDVLGCAQTGTGKTAAFAVPALQRLSGTPAAEPGLPHALVLTPTRELALQIAESFAAYGRHLPLRCTAVFGGVSQAPQVEALRAGCDILVATPGRLWDLFQQKLVSFGGVAVNVHYKPLPMMTAYKNLGFRIEDFPNSYNIYKNEITLPLHTLLRKKDIMYIIKSFKKVLEK